MVPHEWILFCWVEAKYLLFTSNKLNLLFVSGCVYVNVLEGVQERRLARYQHIDLEKFHYVGLCM